MIERQPLVRYLLVLSVISLLLTGNILQKLRWILDNISYGRTTKLTINDYQVGIKKAENPALSFKQGRKEDAALTVAATSETSEKDLGGRMFGELSPETVDRPRLILHIGPPKTGTTFLQSTLRTNTATDILRKDGYVYIGRQAPSKKNVRYFSQRWEGGSRKITIGRSFAAKLEEIKASRQNGIIVEEYFASVSDLHLKVLANFMERSGFDVVIVIAYRRLYEWLPSLYNQRNRAFKNRHKTNAWPGTTRNGVKGQEILPFDLDDRGPFSEKTRSIESTGKHPTEMTLKVYRKHFSNVQVVDMHHLTSRLDDEGDAYLVYLLCGVVPGANHSCKEAQAGRLEGNGSRSNPSVSLNYDILAVRAYEHGLIHGSDNSIMSRPQAVNDIRDHQEKSLNLTCNDFPLKCLSNYTLDRLLNLSLSVEEHLFPSIAAQNEADHRAGFERARAKYTYCHIDAERVLEDDAWHSFLTSLAPQREATRSIDSPGPSI